MGTGPPAADKKSGHISIKVRLETHMMTPGKHLSTLNKAVRTVSIIVQRGSLFLKLYLLHCSENNVQVKLTFSLVRDALKTVCKQPTKGKKPAQRSVLLAFYDEHFAPLLPEGDVRPSFENLGGVLDYAAKDLTTSLENNAPANYVKCVNEFGGQ